MAYPPTQVLKQLSLIKVGQRTAHMLDYARFDGDTFQAGGGNVISRLELSGLLVPIPT
ncbi:MAG TPA: hypothetical protein VH186_04400 [Chloroflexia bacterium]|nr:hypothetical protein [Chloroflexia bacterium]